MNKPTLSSPSHDTSHETLDKAYALASGKAQEEAKTKKRTTFTRILLCVSMTLFLPFYLLVSLAKNIITFYKKIFKGENL